MDESLRCFNAFQVYRWGSAQGLGMERSGATTGAFWLPKSSISGNCGLVSNAECFRNSGCMVSARM